MFSLKPCMRTGCCDGSWGHSRPCNPWRNIVFCIKSAILKAWHTACCACCVIRMPLKKWAKPTGSGGYIHLTTAWQKCTDSLCAASGRTRHALIGSPGKAASMCGIFGITANRKIPFSLKAGRLTPCFGIF